MSKEVDIRNLSETSPAADFARDNAERALRVKQLLPEDHEIQVARNANPLTGTPMALKSRGAEPTTLSFIAEALAHVRATAPALGFDVASAEVPEFVPDPEVRHTSSDAAAVHLYQQYRGIPIFEMVRTVSFDPKGGVRELAGDNTPALGELATLPAIDAAQAARFAAEFLAAPEEPVTDEFGGVSQWPVLDAAQFDPKILATFQVPFRPTVLDKSIFGDVIKAQLSFFHAAFGATRLAWQFEFVMPQNAGTYLVFVSADAAGVGEILYSTSLTHQAAARGAIFTHNPGLTPRAVVAFPRPIADYPVPAPATMPAAFPDWVATDQTSGNLTHATLGFSGNTLAGHASQGVVEFNPADQSGDDQKVLNIFYFCNYMHDFFYLLGFDERAGCFQKVNPDGTPGGGDEVRAFAHSGAVTGTANMSTPPDGQNPTMNMGLVVGTQRHTAFDSDVVFHEFTHGVTNRLVGGRLNNLALQQPQARGQGEGWSDYFALTIQNFGKDTEKVVSGDWVTGRAGGIREFPYDANFPDGFGALGTGRYKNLTPDGRPWPHPIGEIWCATLMQITRTVGTTLGDQNRAYQILWQLVIDALKLSPANPSFLASRDALLTALDDARTAQRVTTAEHAAIRRAMWETFAHFQMGVNAASNGASLSGIVADTTLPNDLGT